MNLFSRTTNPHRSRPRPGRRAEFDWTGSAQFPSWLRRSAQLMAELAAEHRAKAEAGGSEDAAPNHEVAVLELMAAYPLAPRHGGER